MVTKANTPEGYKRTEVGVIPSDWGIDKIKNLASITTGGQDTQDKVEDGLYPFFVRSQTIERINSYSFDGEAVLTAGDGVKTGKVFHYIHGKFDFHQRVYKISNFDKKLDGYYFYLYFSNKFFNRIMSMTAKSSVDSVRMEMIADMPIPLPAKPEQQAIAQTMRGADELITALEKLITKKRNIKQGTMQQLLTGKKRLPGYSSKWEVKRIGEMLDYERPDKYIVKSTDYVENGDIPVLTANKSFVLGFTNEVKGIYKDIPVIIFDDFTTDSKYVTFPFKVKSSAIKILKTKNKLTDLKYLFERMRLVKFPLGGHKRYYISEYQRLALKIPKYEEQEAIAKVLSDMDVEIETLEQKRDKYKMIKQGMMQELLTGRIRLVQQKEVGAPMTTAMKASETTDASPKKAHNWQINEAVVIAVLTGTFGSEQYPLGRKRYTKFSYLLHRHVEGKAEGYRKKAAGPYNPDTRYKGPEKIAQDNRYIKHHATGEFSGFIADENIERARGYFDKWYGGEILQWLEQFRYESNEQLELLTTVDMAVCELAKNKRAVSVAGVKDMIRSHLEWKAKMSRSIFSDENIAAAIEKSQELISV